MADDCTALKAIIRLKAGLSPLERLEDLTIDLDYHKQYLQALLDNSHGGAHEFGVVLGPYGSGKTHFLHVARRFALSNGFAVAQLTQDTGLGSLGHPQRHLFNLVTSLALPKPYGFALEWVASSVTDAQQRPALSAALNEVRPECPFVTGAALWVLRQAPENAKVPLLMDYLSGASLVGKTAHPSTRKQAYELLRFWTVLCTRVLGCRGVILTIDELENLFSNALYWSILSRRAAYRTLSHYTEVLPRTITIGAFTPEGWRLLLSEVGSGNNFFGCATELPAEDMSKLFRRIVRTRPYELAPLTGGGYRVLFERLVSLHTEARGYPRDWVEHVMPPRCSPEMTPRIFSKSVVSALERIWFRSAVFS